MANVSDFKYVEIVTGGPNNRGNVVELTVPFENIDYYGKPNKVDCFHSAFLQTQEYAKYEKIIDGKKTKKFYKGEYFTPLLYWDFDSNDMEKSRADAVELVESLMAYHKENIRIWFSGGKGFHVTYYSYDLYSITNYNNFDSIVKGICLYFAKGLATHDRKIYDGTRIFRTPNSIHSATGLYKIELSYDTLKNGTANGIKQLAKVQNKLEFKPYRESDPDFLEIISQKFEYSNDLKINNYSYDELLNGLQYGFEEGSRNSGYASVAGMLHRRNIDDSVINAILLGVNSRSSNPLSENEVAGIVNSISRYPVDSQYEEVKSEDIVTMKDAGERWMNIITASGDFSLGERYKHLIETMDLVLNGDTIGIVANSGSGKSTLLLDMCNEYAKLRNGYSLFLSLEMAQHACYFRAATMSHEADDDGEVSSKQVAKNLINDKSFREKVERDWCSTLIVDKGSISLEQVQECFQKAQEVTKNKVVIVALDYLQYLDGAHDVSKMMKIARQVKDVAKSMNVITMLAIQTNKSMKNSYIEVEDEHIEGIKAISQALDWNMAFWKSESDPKRLHGKFLKTRWSKTDKRFDLIREGLKYRSTDYVMEKPDGGRL